MDVVLNQSVPTERILDLMEDCRRTGADILVARGRQASILKEHTDFPRLRQAVLQHNTRYMLFHKNVLLSEERLTYPDFSSGSASKPTPCLRLEAALR